MDMAYIDGKKNKVIIRGIFMKINDMVMDRYIGIRSCRFIKVNGKMENKMDMVSFLIMIRLVNN